MDSDLAPTVVNKLRCPCCGMSELLLTDSTITCLNDSCSTIFPVVDGRPILINESRSIFRFSDFQDQLVTTMDLRVSVDKPKLNSVENLKSKINAITPSISYSCNNFRVDQAIKYAWAEFNSGLPMSILVVGAGDAEIKIDGDFDIVYTDLALGRLTDIICDAHDVPYLDHSFDLVIASAVLEHVADPYRCVEEIYRVLKPEGRVYAITPFMQQVHMGKYDFTRFTHLGHRRLFRYFSEIKSGVANGPAMAFAWSFERMISGFAKSGVLRSILRTIARFPVYPFIFLDKILCNRPTAYDAASAYYFFGQKSVSPISDREIIKNYRGAGQR